MIWTRNIITQNDTESRQKQIKTSKNRKKQKQKNKQKHACILAPEKLFYKPFDKYVHNGVCRLEPVNHLSYNLPGLQQILF